MRPQLGECAGCEQQRYIVNKKYGLCQPCNHDRLHGEGSLQKKQLEYTNKLRSGSKGINKKSAKQQAKDRELGKVYEQMAKERPMVCSGCGSTKHLSHSHIIPRSRRDDLETVPENITYHCLVRLDGSSGCHSRWESTGERIFLNDYAKNMEYIKRVEPDYYWLIYYREMDLGIR